MAQNEYGEKPPFIAYKAFNRDMTCLDFQFKEGKTYEKQNLPKLCKYGFHFCKDIVLTLEYYNVNKITDNKYAEVEILGDVRFEEPTKHKGVTNKIRIIRVLSDKDVLELVDKNRNSGNGNSGNGNSGNWSSITEESGSLNTKQSKNIRVFNKKYSRKEWNSSIKPDFLYFSIDSKIGYKESFKRSWEKANKENRELIRDLPNFDADVFYELSGIDLRKGE